MAGFGAFGKMPSLGDFFRLDVAGGFVEPWDRWLQHSIIAMRSQLAERWDACFNSAPLWRFTVAPGLAGPQAMQGVLMASVDRVGRQYPLTLVTALRGNPPVAMAHFAAAATFRCLEDLALECLDDAMTRDRLAEGLRSLAPPQSPVPARMVHQPGLVALASGVAPDSAGHLAAEFVGQRLRAPSLWTAELDDGARFLACEGLPPPEQVTALFDLDAPLWRPGDVP